ncbi:MAG: alpha/beta fold hydrolase [Flavonifractor plautii]
MPIRSCWCSTAGRAVLGATPPVAGGAGGGVHRGPLGSAGSGNTYYRDPAAPPPTVERLLSDLDELVDALRARYGRDRLFLLGHSWGSLLGGLYALRRPEKLSAWLPVSQMVDFKRSEQVSAAEAIRRAREAGREKDAERLAQELEQVLALRRLDRAGPGPAAVSPAEGAVSAAPVRRAVSAGGLAAPELTGNDLRWKLCFDRMLAANAALYEELLGACPWTVVRRAMGCRSS